MTGTPNTPFLFTRCRAYIPLEDLLAMIDSIKQDPSKKAELHYFAVPYSYLEPLNDRFASDENFVFGSESMNHVEQGSFTENIAVLMLKKAGAKFTLLGTSEQRFLLQESDKSIAHKVQRCFEGELEPIVCFGENLQQYRDGHSEEVIKTQISGSLEGLNEEQITKLSLIYEAPWMASYPVRPSADQIVEAQKLCNRLMGDLLGTQMAQMVRVVQTLPNDVEELDKFIDSKTIQGVFVSMNWIAPEQLSLSLFVPKEKEETPPTPTFPEESEPEIVEEPAPIPPEEKPAIETEAAEVTPEKVEKPEKEEVTPEPEEQTLAPEELPETVLKRRTVISEAGASIEPVVQREEVPEESEEYEEEGEFYDEEDDKTNLP